MITNEEFLNSGLPVSDDIPAAEVSFAIDTVTHYIVRPQLGDDFYAEMLADNTFKAKILEGGVEAGKVFTGLRSAYYHLTFAYLVYNSYRLTRFGTVEKTSEESFQVGAEDRYFVAKRHSEIAQQYINEIKSAYNITIDNQNTFSALLW